MANYKISQLPTYHFCDSMKKGYLTSFYTTPLDFIDHLENQYEIFQIEFQKKKDQMFDRLD
jgi:hypothetical protein